MRDLNALLNSLVNIDREQLLAILVSEWAFAERAVANARQRTATQRARRVQSCEHLARLERIISFFRDKTISPDFSESDLGMCQALKTRLTSRSLP
jgi:hypothetical protein